MAVSKRLRYEILRRDNHTCRYCGGIAPEVILTVDHVVAVALGGSDDPGNLVAACKDCNSGKSATPVDAPLVANVEQDAMRWAAAMQRATELAHAERDERIEVEKAVLAFWAEADHYGRKYSEWMPEDWYLSVDRWLDAGLSKEDMLEASHITIYGRRKKPTYDEAWRYFCGICWRMLTERQEAARNLVNTEQPTGEAQDIDQGHCWFEHCAVHDDGVICHVCKEPNCLWACGYVHGGDRVVNGLGPMSAFGSALHKELSLVCDGTVAG